MCRSLVSPTSQRCSSRASQQLLDTVPTGPFDVGDWQNIFTFVIRPLLTTPRSVQALAGLPLHDHAAGRG